ncbi:putative DNA binding protein [uncultured Mediterranean phage uvMED]|nr:putative DNA binding protein [uncultured Mediterranean phage uvMED]BAR22551.1 hypothetical protein [uncultured Mediterranean phage uvMED]
MTVPATNRPLFNQSSTAILERALNSMTIACEALTNENKQLREQVNSLTLEVNRLKEKVVLNL